MKYFLPAIFLALSLGGFLGLSKTQSFLVDEEKVESNVLSVATTFVSITPTPIVGPTPTVTSTPTSPIADHLIINEVMFDPPNTNACGGENDAEWVEIYNPTGSGVNLDTWAVGDTLYTDDLPDVILPAGGFAIVSDCTQTNFNAIWPLPAGTIYVDITSAIGNGFNNDGEYVRLFKGSALIDGVSYGTNTDAFSPSVVPPVANHSIERDPDGIDTDTNADFVDRTAPTPGS